MASIQAFVSRAGYFWRGGAASLAIVFGASIAVAFVVGDVYESESVVEFVDGGVPRDASAEPPDQELQHAVLDPATIEKLARETGPVGAEGPALQSEIERVRASIQTRAREDKRFVIAFRSETPASAQRGSDWLAQAAMHTVAARNDPFGGEEASRRVKTLEDKTRDLAAFVAEHPEVALSPPAATPAPGSSGARTAPAASGSKTAPPADSAMVVLQQQRATLEWRLADAEKKEASGNPYDSGTDRAALQRMIAQVKAAIAARQAVALRAGAESSAAASAGRTLPPAPKSPASTALQAEWQRLVEAVVDAQVQAPAKRDGAAPSVGLRIVQRASLPTRPIKPDKKLIGLLGLAVGVWAGILWAFARVIMRHDLREGWEEEEEEEDVDDADPPDGPREEPGWRVEGAFDHTVLDGDVARQSTPPVTARAGTSSEVLGGEGIAGLRPYSGSKPPGPSRIPKDLMTTAPGVVDVSRVLAQTGMSPDRLAPPHGVSIVDVTRREEPLASKPEREATADRPGTYRYHREGSNPPQPARAPMRATGVTQTFVSPSPAVMRQASRPPNPGAAHHGSRPPEQAPVYGLALRSKPPEDIFSLRDVPLGWSPDPSMLQSGSMKELLTLRDQLYRLAVNGCFVVGVTSARGATADKSCVAAQLASVLAAPGKARVLLMEANFDRPAVHRLMHIDVSFSQGFSEQMRRRMTPAPRTPWVLVRCAPNLHVLAEGLVRSPGLLSSVQFGEALSELRPHYDVVVADGPLADGTVDTVAFDARMDGIVVVGAVGSAPSTLLDEASKWFGRKQLMAVISADASAEQRIEFGSQTT